MLISLHIPRTSGTAWRLFVETNAGPVAAFDTPHEDNDGDPAAVARPRLEAGRHEEATAIFANANIRLIHGHAALDFLTLYPDAGVVAWLRDPRERAVSEFVALTSPDGERGPAGGWLSEGAGFLEFIAQRRGLYAEVGRRLEAHRGAHGFFLPEYRQEAVDLCGEVLGWRGRIERRNQSPSQAAARAEELLREHEQELASSLAADLEVFRHWQGLWASGEARSRLAAALRKGPSYQRPPLAQALRRRAGVLKEALGHSLGRDWR